MSAAGGGPGAGRGGRSLEQMEEWLVGRMSALESQNRSLRRRLGIVTLLLLVVMAVSAVALYLTPAFPWSPATASFSASRFELTDGSGNVRGAWFVREDGSARLVMHDRSDVERLRMTVLAGGAPGIVFAGGAGEPRVVLGVLPDETASLVMADNQGVSRAVLGIGTDQSVNLVFADRTGAMRSALGTDSRGQATFMLPDAETLPEGASPPQDEVLPEVPADEGGVGQGGQE